MGDYLSKPYRHPDERRTTRVLNKLRSTRTTEPTLEDRTAGAAALAAFALDGFRTAAADLEAAADQQEAVAAEVAAEIDRLVDLEGAALSQAFDARSAARKIRDLVSL